jgi:hypothetical protein
MKKTGMMMAVLLTLLSARAAMADGNYLCDNLDVVSGQRVDGSAYNVIVGTEAGSFAPVATVYERPVAPNPRVTATKLEATAGEAQVFTNGDMSFTLAATGSAGTLSLNNGKMEFLCTPQALRGAVTGSN